MGGYISADPIGLQGGLNSWAYTPDPINWVDPLGLRNYIHSINSDYLNKGLHGTFNGLEVSIRPDHQGGFSYKPVFSSTNTNSKAWRDAVSQADDFLNDPKNIDYVQRQVNAAKEHFPERAAEYSHLDKNLEKRKGTLKKCP